MNREGYTPIQPLGKVRPPRKSGSGETKLAHEQEKIDWIESFGKLELHDGDILVLRSKYILPSDTKERIKAQTTDVLKDMNRRGKVSVIVLDEDMDIGVISTK